MRKHQLRRAERFIDWSKWDHLLGVETDDEVADRIGCTGTGVRQRRQALGIKSKYKTHFSPEEQQEYDTLKAAKLRRCTRCKEIKPHSQFHVHAREINRWCKPCRSEYQISYFSKKKLFWVNEAGGGCQCCGYNRWMASLEFHHIDGSREGATPSNRMNSRPVGHADIFQELDKCALLCCNCHRAIHRGATKMIFIKRDGLGWTVASVQN